MANLINPQNTIEVIQKNNFVFQKKFGQNFLVDSHVLDKIIAAAKLSKDDVVLEIGPGIGTITQALAEHAGQVIAVEIDSSLIPILNETLKEYDNVTLINSDILKLDLKELAERYAGGKRIKVVANLPYYITTPIILALFESGIPLDMISIMVQKEVADKMKAKPKTSDYNALSLIVQYYSTPYIVANVPQNCFIPRPTVGSTVVALYKLEQPLIKVDDEQTMFAIIKAAFNQRRKTLQNSIGNAADLNFKKEDVADVLNVMGLKETVRGEELSIEEFAEFTNALLKR